MMKPIQLSEVVPTLTSKPLPGPHISIFLSANDIDGRRYRSVTARLRKEIDQAEYLLRKSSVDVRFLDAFRFWSEQTNWFRNSSPGTHHAFFLHEESQPYWLRFSGDELSLIRTEVIVSETWHLKPLLNGLTHANHRMIRKAIRLFRKEYERRRATDVLHDITQYAMNGQIRMLLVSQARKLWGELDRLNGRFRLHSDQSNAKDDDLMDDLAEMVMQSKGRVLVVPDDWMPTVSPIAAVLKA